MQTLLKFNSATIVKALVAAAVLATLAGVAGRQLAPGVPVQTILLYSALGAAALLAILVVAVAVTLTFRQFILRKGGTDTQWFWFSGEPKGLQQLRAQGTPEEQEPKR